MMKNDEALYQQISQGVMDAFDRLYLRYEGPLFRFILKYVSNTQEAEEVFQEVFMELLKNQNLTFSPGGLKAWLYQVARNRSLNVIKRHQTRYQKEIPIPDRLSTEETFVHRDYQRTIQSTAEGLPEGLAMVYQLRCSGMSYQQIAETLDIPLGTVKSRINQMVKQMKQKLLSGESA